MSGSADSAEELLRALEVAVGAQPDDGTLRRHLVEQYLSLAAGAESRGRWAQAALDHLEVLRSAAPSDPLVLSLLVRAATLAAGPPTASPLDAPTASPLDEPGGEDDGLLVRIDERPDGSIDLEFVDPPDTRLDDVAGLEEVKAQLREAVLLPRTSPELRARYGTSMRGGLLLWGPPGCGKTHLARALAGELGTAFYSIGLHDVLTMWFGESEQRLHDLFEAMRRAAPCLLFLDEVDAIGQRRSNLRSSPGRNVVAQLLSELDGIASGDAEIFVVGATNQVWDVDPALRRPGRFDRTIVVLPPDEGARRHILRTHLAERPTEPRLDIDRLARTTDGCSGADLRLICETAARRALSRAVEQGVEAPIRSADLRAAAREVRPSTGAWLEVARTHAQFSNQTGEYDGLLAYLRARRML